MTDSEWLAERFEEHRTRLTAAAYRMLGSGGEAEDAVQEAWLRFSRSDVAAVQNLGSWLMTVLSRVCLNVLQARRARSEEPLDSDSVQALASDDAKLDPEEEAMLADSLGLALLVILDTLTPAERVAFVLHDMFAVSFDEIGPIVGRRADAARQLASRARRRVQGQDAPSESDGLRQAKLIDAYLAAARNGDFEALLSVLDPEVLFRADSAAIQLGAPRLIRGATAVAEVAIQRARGAAPAIVNGLPSAVGLVGGRLQAVFHFTVRGKRIAGIDLLANAEHLRELDVMIAGCIESGKR